MLLDKALSTLSLAELAFFESVCRHQSLKGASVELDINKSSASRMLAHLREVLDDPLFIRSHPNLIPTETAARVLPSVRTILVNARMLVPMKHLRVGEISRTFLIGAGVNAAHAFCLPVIDKLLDIAPNVRLAIDFTDGDKIFHALEVGELDMAFLPLIPLPDNIHTMTIGTNRLTTLVRRGHPLYEKYLQDGVVTVEDTKPYRRIEVKSAMRGAARKMDREAIFRYYAPHLEGEKTLSISYALCALDLALRHDMLVTFSLRAAKRLVETDDRFVILPLAEDTECYPVRLVWHERQDEDQEAKWLRGLLRAVNLQEDPEAASLLSD